MLPRRTNGIFAATWMVSFRSPASIGSRPDLAEHRHRVAPVRARTDRRPHRRDLFHSSASPLFSIRCSASSSRIINSPIFARARVRSRSSGSVRVLSPRPSERDEAEQRTKTAPHAPGSSDPDQRPLNIGARFSPKARIPSVASSVSKQMFCAMVSIWSAPRRSRSSLA